MSAFLDSNQTIPMNTTIGSTIKLSFLCSVCHEPCMRAPRLARRQTMTCKAHSKKLHNVKRPKYDGPIPLHVRRPIRAGLLLGVDRKQLCDVVASLETIKDTEDPVSLATSYIECVAQYDRVCLADSCFWGDASGVRVDGVRVPHKKKRKAVQVNNNDVPVVDGTDQNTDTHKIHEGVPCHMHTATHSRSLCTENTLDDVALVSEPTFINDCEASSPTVVPVIPTCIDDNETRDIRPTSPAAEEVGEMSIVSDQQDTRHHETGLWDDVVCAVRDDLRAFWGLWESDIAPRVDGGLPVTYKDAVEWNGDNVDVVRVLSQLRCFTRLVATMTDNWVPKTSFEKRVLFCVQSLILNLDCCKRDDKANLQLFIQCILGDAQVPEFVYPRPVN
jgi:hypothetical protein